MFRALCASTVLALLVAAPRVARAVDTRPGVLPLAVALDDESAEAAGAVRIALISAVRSAGRHQLVHPSDAFDPEGRAERDNALKEGAAAMAAGHRAFESLEDGLGTADFARAEAAYAVAGPRALEYLVQARVLKLAVRWPEDPASVRRALPDLFSLAPEAKFPADMTPPDLAQEVARARDAVRGATRGSLDVTTTPPGAQLFVDGVSRGTTPASLSDLAQGEHQLALYLPGHRWRHAAVVVGPNTRATYALEPTAKGRELLALQGRIARQFGEEGECDAVRDAAGGLPAAAELLLAGVRRDGRRWEVTLQRLALPDAHVHGTETLVVQADAPDRDNRLLVAVSKLLTKDRARGRGGAPLGLESGFGALLAALTDVRPVTFRPVLAVAAVGLVAGGAVVGLRAGSAEKTLRATAQTDDRLETLQWEVYRTAVLSDGLTTAGLVLGAVWGWWKFGTNDAPAPGKAGSSAPAGPSAPDEVTPLVLPEEPSPSAGASGGPVDGTRWSVDAGPGGLGVSGVF